MAMANSVTSVIDLIRRFLSSSSSSSSSVSELEADLQKLAASLSGVLPVLDGAEESDDEHVKLWLAELKCAAYDVEDVLDEFEFDMLRLEAATAARVGKRKRGASDPGPGPSRGAGAPPLPSSYAARVRGIRERLDAIQKDKGTFSLREAEGARRAETVPLRRLPSAPGLDVSRVYGRDNDVEEVVGMLLSPVLDDEGAGNLSVVSIVGMGGLGKTTLAQMVYTDGRVRERFETRSWVHVSEKFDPIRLTRAILESITRRKAVNNVGLNVFQGLLKEELTEKRFLLVLDDVWCEDPAQWAAFMAPLTCGARGSRALITTRMETVAKVLDSTIHQLDVLFEGDCWSLFSHYAFGGKSDHPDYGNIPTSLVEIGKEIVKKCRGLPLTVKTLGGLLSYETDERRWDKVLSSEIWEVSEGKRCILPGLKLSYSLLPSSMKQCFLYCGVFPKSQNFARGQMVRWWIAQGFLRPQAEEHHHLEDVANECFDNLMRRSFLGQAEEYWDDAEEDEELYTMHDLVHDMVRTISMEEFSVIEEGNFCSISPNARHSSIVCSSIEGLLKFQSICPKSLRTFLLMEMKDELNTQVLDGLFQKLTCVRVLDLSFANMEEIPASVGNLKHLRYLGLQGTNITRLPESVGGLYHLQTLETQHCELVELPKSLGNLINLRHLVHHNYDYATSSLSKMPNGIGKLTSLKTLPIFVVSNDPKSASVGELKNLNDLRGSLFIVGLHNVGDGVTSTKEANLKGKKHLDMLLLEWGEGAMTSSPSICKQDVDMLENLEPHTDLKEFHLMYNYRGIGFPTWMGDPRFSSLETVVISGCTDCKFFPPLGQLPSLKFLSICEMNCVHHVGSEFLGEGRVRGFPSLLALHFRDLPEWEHWWRMPEAEGYFPLLRDLTVEDCPKLESLSLHNLTALQDLTIKNCAGLVSVDCLSTCSIAGPQRGHAPSSSLKNLKLYRCPKLDFSPQEPLPSTLQRLHSQKCHLVKEWCQAHCDLLAQIPDLCVTGEELSIHDIMLTSRATAEELKLEEGLQKLELGWYLGRVDYEDKPEDVLTALEPHTNLRELTIKGYRGLSFARWLGDPSFSNLVKITLIDCNECTGIPALGKLPSLKELHISLLPKVQYIGPEFSNGGFPSLETLELQDMSMWKEWEVTVEGAFPCLRHLNINSCPKLSRLDIALTGVRSQFRLKLQQFDDDVIFKGLHSLFTCTALRISQFPNLRGLPHQLLPCNLRELEIEGCNRLKALPHLPKGVRCLVLTACSEKILCSSRSFSPFLSLSHLWISSFLRLKTLPLNNLPSLKELCISSCPELVSLSWPRTSSPSQGSSVLTSLRLLSIKDCPMLEFKSEEQLPSLLQYMDINGCQFLAEWCRKHSSKISHVSKLWIDGILISTCDTQCPDDGLIANIEEAARSLRDEVAP